MTNKGVDMLKKSKEKYRMEVLLSMYRVHHVHNSVRRRGVVIRVYRYRWFMFT